ncbi:MAG TPA: DoxX family protein [Pseudonocardia sp.]|jgi:putative oxidoreductase|nr:DoxX family protein [Pseudonocardia sp.]
MLLRPLTGPARDAALAVGRILLGVVLMAHGYQKVFTYGLAGTTKAMTKMSVPLPPVSAAYASYVELLGGALLILGALTTVVSVLVVLDMIGAAVFSGSLHTVFAQDGGWELVGMIGVGALLLAAVGAGRFSVDHALAARRTTSSTAPVAA